MSAPTLDEAAAVVEEIERRFPVLEWRADGCRCWPLVRVRLGYGLIGASLGGASARDDTGASAAAAHAARLARAAPRLLGASARPGSVTDVRREAGAVFLSDGRSFVRFGGEWYDRHCDPIRDGLREAGIPSLLLVAGHRPEVPARRPAAYIQLRLDEARARARLRPATDLHVPAFDQVRDHLRALGLEAHLPGPPVIRVAMAAVLVAARWFERVLRRCRARAGFVVEYYALQGMAFALACRRAGIPSVDLQHGVQSALHFAYGRWGAVPPEGYELLPRFFWVWGPADADVIEAWRGECRDHWPVVGGNPFLDLWRSGGSTLTADTETAMAAPRGVRPEVSVLVTLQGHETPAQLAWLTDLAAGGPPGWFWWFRGHPVSPRTAVDLDALLRARGVTNADVARASAVPLYGVLRHVDVHVTSHSSVVLEAEQFGVPSVVFDPVGEALYADQIGRGTTRVAARDPGAVIAAVREQAAAPPARAPVAGGPSGGIEWAVELVREERSVA